MSRHRFHGDPTRFAVVAEFVADRFGRDVRYIADVAGGQGMLARLLTKRHGYECEVIDPREWVLRGVRHEVGTFDAGSATYYDLLIGLHCDEALRELAQAALVRPTVVVPCCNFWSEDKLGRDELLEALEGFYTAADVRHERVIFAFSGPKNIGIVTFPPG
jgi:hypothetical protein